MKQLQGSKAAVKLFSPAALALAAGLACWGSVALADDCNSVLQGVSTTREMTPTNSGCKKPALVKANMAKDPSEQKKICEDTFTKNKDGIERLITAGNKAGVVAIFDKAGCGGIGLKVNGTQDKMASKVRCTFTLIPPAIICTFGAKLFGPNSNKQ